MRRREGGGGAVPSKIFEIFGHSPDQKISEVLDPLAFLKSPKNFEKAAREPVRGILMESRKS